MPSSIGPARGVRSPPSGSPSSRCVTDGVALVARTASSVVCVSHPHHRGELRRAAGPSRLEGERGTRRRRLRRLGDRAPASRAAPPGRRREHRDSPVCPDPRTRRRGRVRARVRVGMGTDRRAFRDHLRAGRLRRGTGLQSAGHLLHRRPAVQACRVPVRVRSARPLPGALRRCGTADQQASRSGAWSCWNGRRFGPPTT